jgi:tRNA (cmo5U34)-methyltransferase
MDSPHNKDNVFAKPLAKISDFVFDENVSRVFKDMIERSIPGYNAILSMIGVLTEKYAQADSRCYDLGASLGAATLAMRRKITVPHCTIESIDNSEAMVARCKQNIERDDSPVPVTVACADIRDVKIENASVVVMNFVLQFIDSSIRLEVMKKIYSGMNSGGIFILSEKIDFSKKAENEFQTELYHTFKKMNGYSDLEISQKRTALEKVLIPDTRELHYERLFCAGFKEVYTWFQCFNFVSMVAIK